MLAAGMKGMEEGYELAAPVEEDIFEMNAKQLKKHKISALPATLGDAIAADRQELSWSRKPWAITCSSKFLENKTAEWDAFRLYVTDWELDRYLSIL